ncbi:uncharacterized protein LOC126680609 [Mercurialis annua]|uniref:uncharacterized protein LOC126680609 n=1 Tax=Mercurialis annua TaxID=3986 RepID=UPI00215E9124|nr:uncharacterized protein LOC126680609 [Mercurialis annua]
MHASKRTSKSHGSEDWPRNDNEQEVLEGSAPPLKKGRTDQDCMLVFFAEAQDLMESLNARYPDSMSDNDLNFQFASPDPLYRLLEGIVKLARGATEDNIRCLAAQDELAKEKKRAELLDVSLA